MTTPTTDLTTSDAAELARAIGAGELTSAEVTRAYLDRIAAEDGRLGAYLHVDPEAAQAAAEQADHVTGWDHYLPRLPVYAARVGAGTRA